MPVWVKDEDIWEKAKQAFKKSYGHEPESDKDWAIVTSIYKKMGGKISTEVIDMDGDVKEVAKKLIEENLNLREELLSVIVEKIKSMTDEDLRKIVLEVFGVDMNKKELINRIRSGDLDLGKIQELQERIGVSDVSEEETPVEEEGEENVEENQESIKENVEENQEEPQENQEESQEEGQEEKQEEKVEMAPPEETLTEELNNVKKEMGVIKEDMNAVAEILDKMLELIQELKSKLNEEKPKEEPEEEPEKEPEEREEEEIKPPIVSESINEVKPIYSFTESEKDNVSLKIFKSLIG